MEITFLKESNLLGFWKEKKMFRMYQKIQNHPL